MDRDSLCASLRRITRSGNQVALRYGAGVRQFVLLGAGFDSRAWRLPLAGATVFELDVPEAEARKQSVSLADVYPDGDSWLFFWWAHIRV